MCGQFDLKVFDEVPTTDLIDTKDTNIASATSTSFQDAFKAFKFYQRPLTDNAMIGSDGLIAKNTSVLRANTLQTMLKRRLIMLRLITI